jgi:hypothetical protein
MTIISIGNVYVLTAIQSNSSRSYQEEEIFDLKTYINTYETELNFLNEEYKSQLSLIQNMTNSNDEYDAEQITNYLSEIESVLNNSETNLKLLLENYDKLTNDFEKDLEESRIALKGYQEEMLNRKKIGITEVNKLMSNFLNKNKTRDSLGKIIEILNKENTNNRMEGKETNSNSFLRKEKSEQFTRLRIYYSYRLEEILNNFSDSEVLGVDLMRAMLASLYSSLPPIFCWVDDTNLGTFDILKMGEKNSKRLANIFYELEEDNFYTKGGIILETCPPDQTDCSFFCSTSDCNSPKNFNFKKIKTQDFEINGTCQFQYRKKGTLCYPVCEKIKMVTCDTGICAATKLDCKKKIPKIVGEDIEAFVDFLGHIYSLSPIKKFGWANPTSLEKDLNILNKFKFENSQRQSSIYVIMRKYFNSLFIKKLRKTSQRLLKIDVSNENYDNHLFKTETALISALDYHIGKITDSGFVKYNFKNESLNSCRPFAFYSDKFIFGLRNTDACKFLFMKLLKEMEPYMFIGFASSFAKPICPFSNIKTSLK